MAMIVLSSAVITKAGASEKIAPTKDTGPLVTVTGAGGQPALDVDVWLNGDAQLSGQRIHVPVGNTLTVTPTHPTHRYPAMGIEVVSPGFSGFTTGCDRYAGGRCIFSASHSNPATVVAQPHGLQPIVFFANATTLGNFSTGPADNGDAFCQSHASGGLFDPNNYDIHAITITSTRFPCNYVAGVAGCMMQGGVTYNSPDWPIIPNTQYSNPDGTSFEIANANGVFLGTNPNLQLPNGTTPSPAFLSWVGIQELIINNLPPSSIIGWGLNDLNPGPAPNQDGINYANYSVINCADWTSTGGNGAIGQQGAEVAFIADSGAFNALAGNYFAWTNGTGEFTWGTYPVNVWSIGNQGSCSGRARVICIGNVDG